MPLDSLEGTLAHDMSDLLSAETQFARALQQVARSASSQEVKQMAEQHHAETLQQIENLKQAFTALGEKPERMVCRAAKGIVEENQHTLQEEKPKGIFKDIALVCGSAKAELYEVATYRAAVAVARTLGQREVTQLLQANLKQEEATAKKLETAAQQLLQQAKSSAPVTSASKATASKTGASKGGATKSQASSGSKAGGSKSSSSKGGSKKGGSK